MHKVNSLCSKNLNFYHFFFFRNPETVSDETELSCLGDYGGPIFPWVALGGFDAKNYLNATAAVVTVPAVNYYDDAEKVAMAMAWESK